MSCFWNRFSRHSAIMRQAARSDVALMMRLVDAPPRTFHVYAIALDIWSMDALPLQPEVVAQRFMSVHLRDLLEDVWGTAPAGVLSVLNRCGQTVHAPEFYFMVQHCLADDRLGMLLRRGTDPVNAALIRSIEDRVRLDPLLDEIRHTLHSEYFACIDWLVYRLRDLQGPAFNERWVRGVLKAVDKRNVKHQVRQLLKAFPPAPAPWPGNEVLRPVETVSGLEEAGRAMSNCLGETPYAFALIQGTAAFYVSNNELVVQISKRPSGHWAIEEIRGPRNSSVNPALEEAIRMTMVREGVLNPRESATDLAHMMRFL